MENFALGFAIGGLACGSLAIGFYSKEIAIGKSVIAMAKEDYSKIASFVTSLPGKGKQALLKIVNKL